MIAIAIGAISLLPTPVYPQYFAYCFPFLIVATVCLVHDLVAELESPSAGLLGAGGCVSLMVIYLIAPVNDLHRYLVTGEGIPGLERAKDKEDWRVQRILEVSRAIDGMARPGETVISLWPGYLFQTHTVPLRCLESDFSLPVAAKVSPEHRRVYHALTAAELDEEIANHRTQLVVLGNENRLMNEVAKPSVELLYSRVGTSWWSRSGIRRFIGTVRLTAAELDDGIANHRTQLVVLGNHDRLMYQIARGSLASTLQANGCKLVHSIGDTTIHVCWSGTDYSAG